MPEEWGCHDCRAVFTDDDVTGDGKCPKCGSENIVLLAPPDSIEEHGLQ